MLAILALLALAGVLFGKHVFLGMILSTDTAPLEPVTTECQTSPLPPASTAGITIEGFTVGHNKLTSVITGRKEEWVPIKSYLIRHPQGLIVVDPGPDFRRIGFGGDLLYNGLMNRLVNPIRTSGAELLSTQVAARGYNLPDVRSVIINHNHSDHTGNLELFPYAHVIINDIEYKRAHELGARIGAQPDELAIKEDRLQAVDLSDAPSVATFDHSLDLFGDQTVYLVSLPGHTPGQTGLLVQTEIGPALLSSDALARNADLEARYAMPGQHDRKQFLESLHQIDCFRKALPNATIYPGHDEPIGDNH